jgi:hypothetical protein
VEIADPETGLVFGLSQFRKPMEQDFVKIVGVPGVKKIDMPFKAFDLPAAHLYKIRGGKFTRSKLWGSCGRITRRPGGRAKKSKV